MIEDPNLKTRARVEITGSYAQSENHAKAIASLNAVFQEFDAMRDNAISSAKEAAKNAKTTKKTAPKLANKALKADTPKEEKAVPDPKAVEQAAIANAELLKTRSLFLVANQYLVSKQYDKALEVIDNLDGRSVEKSVGIANVAIAYTKEKKNDEAIKLFDQSLQGLSAIAPSMDVLTLLIEVGRQYQALKSTDLAAKAWEQSLVIAKAIQQPVDRLFALNIIASTYGEFGLAEKVEPILQESLAIAKSAPDPNIRSRAYSDISSTYWAIGQRDKAKEIAQTIENPTEKSQLEKLFACAG
jgi:tetratricopeptide (TPR) repeat protein